MGAFRSQCDVCGEGGPSVYFHERGEPVVEGWLQVQGPQLRANPYWGWKTRFGSLHSNLRLYNFTDETLDEQKGVVNLAKYEMEFPENCTNQLHFKDPAKNLHYFFYFSDVQELSRWYKEIRKIKDEIKISSKPAGRSRRNEEFGTPPRRLESSRNAKSSRSKCSRKHDYFIKGKFTVGRKFGLLVRETINPQSPSFGKLPQHSVITVDCVEENLGFIRGRLECENGWINLKNLGLKRRLVWKAKDQSIQCSPVITFENIETKMASLELDVAEEMSLEKNSEESENLFSMNLGMKRKSTFERELDKRFPTPEIEDWQMEPKIARKSRYRFISKMHHGG